MSRNDPRPSSACDSCAGSPTASRTRTASSRRRHGLVEAPEAAEAEADARVDHGAGGGCLRGKPCHRFVAQRQRCRELTVPIPQPAEAVVGIGKLVRCSSGIEGRSKRRLRGGLVVGGHPQLGKVDERNARVEATSQRRRQALPDRGGPLQERGRGAPVEQPPGAQAGGESEGDRQRDPPLGDQARTPRGRARQRRRDRHNDRQVPPDPGRNPSSCRRSSALASARCRAARRAIPDCRFDRDPEERVGEGVPTGALHEQPRRESRVESRDEAALDVRQDRGERVVADDRTELGGGLEEPGGGRT